MSSNWNASRLLTTDKKKNRDVLDAKFRTKKHWVTKSVKIVFPKELAWILQTLVVKFSRFVIIHTEIYVWDLHLTCLRIQLTFSSPTCLFRNSKRKGNQNKYMESNIILLIYLNARAKLAKCQWKLRRALEQSESEHFFQNFFQNIF